MKDTVCLRVGVTSATASLASALTELATPWPDQPFFLSRSLASRSPPVLGEPQMRDGGPALLPPPVPLPTAEFYFQNPSKLFAQNSQVRASPPGH